MEINSQVKGVVERITPSEAENYLKRNNNNWRKHVKQQRIVSYAKAMASKKWRLNGEPIIFNEKDDLKNGQHRLRACIMAKSSFDTLVVRGIKDGDDETMDMGKSRNFSDWLSHMGETQSTVFGAVCTWLWRAKNGCLGPTTLKAPTQFNELKDIYIQYGSDIRKTINKFPRNKLIPHSIATFLGIITSKTDSVKSNEFFLAFSIGALPNGNTLQQTSPIYRLRERLIKDRTSSLSSKLPSLDKRALVIKAWNLYIKDYSCNLLKWASSTEDFPVVEDVNGNPVLL